MPPLKLTQYAHSAWRLQDGAFDGAPNAIAQTSDGYIWIGTEDGLVRFDGVRFVPMPAPAGGQRLHFSVYSLLGTKDGSLWIGTEFNVQRWQNNRIAYSSKNLGRVNSLLQGQDGKVWLARTRIRQNMGPLCSIDGEDVRCYGEADGMSCHYGQVLANDGSGGLWVGSNPGVCHWSQQSKKMYLPSKSQEGDTHPAISAIGLTRSGEAVIGYSEAGPQLGLQRLVDDHWEPVNADGLRGESLQVSTLLADRDGSLWVGTIRDGLYHILGGRADHFGTAEGLSGSLVSSLYEDEEGSVWVATSGGVDRFHRLKVTPFTQREGLISDNATSILARRDGSVLIGGVGGINILKDGRLSTARAGKDAAGRLVTSMLAGADGTVWIGLNDELTIFDHGRFQPIPTADGHSPGQVLAILEDRQGQVWAVCAGRRRRLFHVTRKLMTEVPLPSGDPKPAIAADPVSGFWVELENGTLLHYHDDAFDTVLRVPHEYDIKRLQVSPDGSVWAWGETGLLHWQHGVWEKLDSHNGLPCDSIQALIDDNRGTLWLDMRCGIAEISKTEVDAWVKNSQHRVAIQLTIDPSEGARPGSFPFAPEAALSTDGELWLAHDGVLQVIDPKNLTPNKIPPPVHIEQIEADGRFLGAGDKIVLPPLTRSIQIDYTGLSFISPQKVLFRYRLSGVDKSWQDVGSRRQAFYMNLPPGTYAFEVMACNNDGLWNTTGDKMQLVIRPAWYQTVWFRALSVLAAIAAVWGLILVRVRYATARVEEGISQRLSERDRIARELHDTLLQGFQGLLLRFQIAANAIPASEHARELMESALDRADEVLLEGRDRVRDLRSQAMEIELKAALEKLASDLQHIAPATFAAREIGTPRPLQRVVKEEVFAIGREALSNAFRHSGATSIECEIVYQRRRFLFTCQDNGTGIDPEILHAGGREGHWGLLGMRERARRLNASLRVQSNKTGTRIDLSIRGRIAYHHADRHATQPGNYD